MCTIAYGSADLVISQGQEMAELMQLIYGLAEAKVEVLYSPVLHGKVRKRTSNPYPKSQALRILNVARIAPAKDQMTLIESFESVRRWHQDIHLFLLGSYAENDPYYCSLVAYIKSANLESSVTFLGHEDQVVPYLKYCDVFVLSSRNEGMPGALIEAMNYQCKVVSTACPVGPMELLADQYPESLVPVGDPDMMARAIWQQLQKAPSYKPVYDGLERFHVDSALDTFYQHFQRIA
jgi:glycosyltransferase involved in cell wall biosynthesis